MAPLLMTPWISLLQGTMKACSLSRFSGFLAWHGRTTDSPDDLKVGRRKRVGRKEYQEDL